MDLSAGIRFLKGVTYLKIIVRGKNFEVTDALREWVEKKLGKIEKYFNDLKEIQVVLVVNRDRHRAEVTIPLDGIVLRGEEETGDMYSSVDMVIDKLEKQIKKYKTKIDRKLKNGSIKDLKVPRGELQAEYEEPKIVRTKRFAMKPMTVEEAILQMNLVGHNFFVFRNSETDMVNVVYQRKDGNYGLIEPEY
ncbi:MAG: SSU ribosomal protein S30P [Clostridia bacterium 41_269]|nr:MAG: SSU ribosomal protein S30P [Clostridia bacterium 41_269]